MKYSCCRSVTSNVLINFQLVTLIESNVYCLATIQAGRVRVETDGTMYEEDGLCTTALFLLV